MSAIAEVLKEQRTGVAYYLWWRRGCPPGDDQRDWYDAERLLEEPWTQRRTAPPPEPEALVWEKWARDNLGNRPYLAIEAAADRAGLVQKLQRLHAVRGPRVETTTAVLAALDGSCEYSRQCWRAPSGNGGSARRVEAKDGRFYRFCLSTFSLHAGIVLGDLPPPAPGSNGAAVPRLFQDGCGVAFAEPARAVAAALHLQRALASCNEVENRPWSERLHARVALGPSWDAATRCLPLTWRGETVIAPECFEQLRAAGEATPLAVQLLFAAGVRVGPRA